MADPRGIRTRTEWTRALQALFTRAGLSYHVLGERCGTSTSTLQEMVTGQSFPRPSTVRLFVQACGERDTQPWVDARARVKGADVALRRRRTPPGRQIRIGTVPRPADCFQEREVADRLERAAEDSGTVVLTQVLAGTCRFA
jgi:Helix-turn-helix domain